MIVRIAEGETLSKVGLVMCFPTSKVDENLSWFFSVSTNRMAFCVDEFNLMTNQKVTPKQIILANCSAFLNYCELIRRECNEKTLLVSGSHFWQAGDQFLSNQVIHAVSLKEYKEN